MADRGPRTVPSTDLVTVLEQRANLAETLANPDLTLARAAADQSPQQQAETMRRVLDARQAAA